MQSIYYFNDGKLNTSIPVFALSDFYKEGLETVNQRKDKGVAIVFPPKTSIKLALGLNRLIDNTIHTLDNNYKVIFMPKTYGILSFTIDNEGYSISTNAIGQVDIKKGVEHEYVAINIPTSTPESLLRWLIDGEKGTSSIFMTHTVYGLPKQDPHSYFDPAEYSFPVDAADFRRCYELVELVPEIKSHFDKIAATGEEWRVLIEEWDRLSELLINNDKHLRAEIRELVLTEQVLVN
jgi:hypothetical protein